MTIDGSSSRRLDKRQTEKSTVRSSRRSMTGATVAGFHEGSRSEILADYLFSAWGTVTPVRRQSDYGLDLYCTLTETVGRRARVQEYFSVQIKSISNPIWKFNDAASVRWLLGHPLPLFLCTVDKKKGLVRVYHSIPRFQIWALGKLPDSVQLKPEKGIAGKFDTCAELPACSLSAPILEVSLVDLTDEARLRALRNVFAYWVNLDRENCELMRAGLLRFRRPDSYRCNERPSTNTQIDLSYTDDEILKPGILRLAEAIECIGGQLSHPSRGRYALLGLEAAMLLDRIQNEFPEAFRCEPFWQRRVPGLLHQFVVARLQLALGTNYVYSGLDTVKSALENLPLVRKYLEQ